MHIDFNALRSANLQSAQQEDAGVASSMFMQFLSFGLFEQLGDDVLSFKVSLSFGCELHMFNQRLNLVRV